MQYETYMPVTPLAKAIDRKVITAALEVFMKKYPRASSQSLDSEAGVPLDDWILGSPEHRNINRDPKAFAETLAPIVAVIDFMHLSGLLEPGVNDPTKDGYSLRAWWLGNVVQEWARNTYGDIMAVQPSASEVELAFHIMGVSCAFDDVASLHIQMMAGRGEYVRDMRTIKNKAAKENRWLVWVLGAFGLYLLVTWLF